MSVWQHLEAFVFEVKTAVVEATVKDRCDPTVDDTFPNPRSTDIDHSLEHEGRMLSIFHFLTHSESNPNRPKCVREVATNSTIRQTPYLTTGPH